MTITDVLPLIVFAGVVLGVLALRTLFPRVDQETTEGTKDGRTILHRGQWVDLICLPGLVIALFLIMLHLKYDYVSMLWQTELGIKMMVVGLAQFLVGEVILALLYFLRNRSAPSQRGLRVLLSITFFLTFLCFILPAVFVILVGPAAIQIMEAFK
jgi:hypothetical protein